MATTPSHGCPPQLSAEVDQLLTAEDVAALIGMTADYVYALARRGAIPVVRFGRSVRFRRGSIERWLASLEVSGR
jgi:excisionase family DNA binding protein